MDEMNRFVSDAPASEPGRASSGRDGRRKLVDRVAQVRPTLPADPARPGAAPVDAPERPNGSTNGNGTGAGHPGPQAAAVAGAAAATAPSSVPLPPQPVSDLPASVAAAEMPKTGTIPEPRKPRLLDRITGLSKG
jgi:hypothetical protein